jgi:hypothetical protein
MASSDRTEELAHGGLVSRTGDIVTLADGSRWWLNGTAWARSEADTLTHIDRPRAEYTA